MDDLPPRTPHARGTEERSGGGDGGRFEDHGPLGAGGMGVVRLAWDRKDRRFVALKTLREFDPESALFLRREFRALRNIRHPNLVRLYELFATSDACYFTMEALEGEDLWTACRGGAPVGALPERPLAEVAELFLQVADGLAAVHAAERLHRDIKPTNVMVSPQGRARVLDFGLAHVFGPGSVISSPDGMSGTPDYVSPEQAWQLPLSVATDWYSFGAMLYEALCGERPFAGRRLGQRMMDLRSKEAPLLSERLPGAPPRLVELCAGLLARDPTVRAGQAEVSEVLGAWLSGPRVAAPPPTLHLPFVGRRAHLDALGRLYQDVRAGDARAAVVSVRGPSGIGKSELMRRFFRGLEAEDGALVLQGRCQPQETVPFKAFDAAIDELAIFLGRQPDDQVEPLLPPELPSLLRLFPVLRRVPVFEPYGERPQPLEPSELRKGAYRALRELLSRMSRRSPVVLLLDDFQWADLDSLGLLAELLRAPGAPGVFVLLPQRSEDVDTSPALRRLAALASAELADIAHTLDLGPLAAEELAELGDHLRGQAGLEVDTLVRQSAGSPFIVGELVRWRRTGGEGATVGTVDDAIRARVAALRPEERAVVEVVAVAGHPLEPALALSVAGVADGGAEVLYTLDEAWLRRVATGDDEERVEPLHDRLREVVAADVDAARAAGWHLSLALALRERPGCDPLLLLDHYRKAGERREAARFAELAALRAEATLAFALAAELYRLTVELSDGRVPWRVRVRLAEALKNAGFGADAGVAYEEAAAALATQAHNTRDRQQLHQRAAEHFLHSGHIQRGINLLAEGLSRVGASVPSSAWGGLLRAAWYRVRLGLRGLAYVARDPSTLDPDVQARLDALWGATTALSMFSHSRADPLGVLHLREALDAGDRVRIERALRYEAAFLSGLGEGFAGRLLGWVGVLPAVAALPEPVDVPYDRAWRHLCDMCVAWFRADWAACARAGRAGEEIFRTECRGAHWEIAVINLFLLAALVFLGEVAETDRRVRDGLRDALTRGDAFAATIYRLGEPLSVWLWADQPDEAERLATEAIGGWSGGDFDTQHYHHLLATAHIALYRGDAWAAWAHLLDRWPDLRRSQLLQYRAVATELHHLRGRVALAVVLGGAPAPAGLSAWTRERLLAHVKADAGRVRAVRELAWSAPLADALDGTRAAVEGRRGAGRLAMEGAASGFEAVGMRLHALAVRHRLAELSASGSGAAIEAELRSLGIVSPPRMLHLLAPWSSALCDAMSIPPMAAPPRGPTPPGGAPAAG